MSGCGHIIGELQPPFEKEELAIYVFTQTARQWGRYLRTVGLVFTMGLLLTRTHPVDAHQGPARHPRMTVAAQLPQTGHQKTDSTQSFVSVVNVFVLFPLTVATLAILAIDQKQTGNIKKASRYYPTFKTLKKRLKGETTKTSSLSDVFQCLQLLEDLDYKHGHPMENYLTALLLHLGREGYIVLTTQTMKRNGRTTTETIIQLDKHSRPTRAVYLYDYLVTASRPHPDQPAIHTLTATQLEQVVSKDPAAFRTVLIQTQTEAQNRLDRNALRLKAPATLTTADPNRLEAGKVMGYAYTDEGLAVRDDVVRLHTYLVQLMAETTYVPSHVERFDKLMVYAAAYGLTKELATYFDSAHALYPNEENRPYYSLPVNAYTRLSRTLIHIYKQAPKQSSSDT